MVALQKADTNLDEVVNDVNNLVNCTHCHGPVFFSSFFFFFFFFFLFLLLSVLYMCVGVCVCLFFFFFFFVLYLRYMNERGGRGEEREKEIVMDGYMLMNKKKNRKKGGKKRRTYVINSITRRCMVDTKMIRNCYTGLEYNNTQTQVNSTNGKGK